MQIYTYFGAAIFFFLGACLGSFLNVVLYRQARGEDWVNARSKCENCAHKIAWYDNIPLLSWIILGGKCRYCKIRISFIHPIMEMLMGLLFLWWFVVGNWFFHLATAPLTMIQPAFWLVIGILLIVLAMIDLQDHIIPDWISIFLILWIFAYRLILVAAGAMQLSDFLLSLGVGVGVGVIFLIFHYLVKFIYKRDGFGLGDVKFIVVMGFLLSWPKFGVGIFLAFALAAITGIVLIIFKKANRQTELPFGPFLVLGTFLALVWGEQLWTLFFG